MVTGLVIDAVVVEGMVDGRRVGEHGHVAVVVVLETDVAAVGSRVQIFASENGDATPSTVAIPYFSCISF